MAAAIALLFALFASAAPVPDTPTQSSLVLTEPAYVPEPKGRGTLRLLISCIFTLVICVWTAIHPNIVRNPTLFRRLGNKAFYVVLALFSPEIVLSIAFSEWRAASEILRAARLSGAVAYAKAELKRVDELKVNEIWKSIPETERARVEQAAQHTRDAARDAEEATATAIRAATGSAEKSKASPDLSRDGDLSRWIEPQKLQGVAFESARELRVVLREFQTECRPGMLYWVDKVVNALYPLRRPLATKWLFSQDPIEHDLGKECSFFAVMGGFTFCPLNEEHNPDHEVTLAPDALTFLLREEYITTAALANLRAVVSDKGKSDMIAKLLVCIQGVWMGVNCLSRKVAGLPLTLLELNVVMHVLCALTVYVCWWKKPHDAGLPISLSRFFPYTNFWALLYTADKYGPKLRCSLGEPTSVETQIPNDPDSSNPDHIESVAVATPAVDHLPPADHWVESAEKNELDDGGSKVWVHFEPTTGVKIIGAAAAKDIPSSVPDRELAICAAAAKEIRRLHMESSPLVSLREGPYPLSTRSLTMTSRRGNFKPGHHLFWVLVPLCLIYGGAHALAWNRHFPTATERLLWRISCIIVATPGPGAAAVWFFEFLFSRRGDILAKLKERFKASSIQLGKVLLCTVGLAVLSGAAGGSIYGLIRVVGLKNSKLRENLLIGLGVETAIVAVAFCVGVVAAIVALVAVIAEKWRTALLTVAVPITAIYCAARAFIVIESFISMRSLPLGAYKTVSWENVWPHV